MDYYEAQKLAAAIAKEFGVAVKIYGTNPALAGEILILVNPDGTEITGILFGARFYQIPMAIMDLRNLSFVINWNDIDIQSLEPMNIIKNVQEAKDPLAEVKLCNCGVRPHFYLGTDDIEVVGHLECPKCGKKTMESPMLGDIVDEWNSKN